MTPQTVNKWIGGEIVPSPERWATIEAALDMEPGHLSALMGLPTDADQLAALRAQITAEVLAEVTPQIERALARLDALTKRRKR